MKPERVIRDLGELRELRAALALVSAAEFTLNVAAKGPLPPRLIAAAEAVVAQVLPPAELATRLATKIGNKIAAIEAQYPGFVD